MQEPTENEKQVIADRATEIQTGAAPLVMSNASLGIPDKPDFMLRQTDHSFPANWTFTELLAQKKKVATVTINTSSPYKKPVWKFVHNFDNVLNLHFRSFKNLFHLWKWNLHFLFEFRSNYQQVGQMIIVNHTMPQGYVAQLKGTVDLDYKDMVQLPHVLVPMGEDVDVTASLKWDVPVECTVATSYHYKYRNNNPDNIYVAEYDMGSIELYPWWTMQIAQGVNPSLTCVIWSWLTDVHMSSYMPTNAY